MYVRPHDNYMGSFFFRENYTSSYREGRKCMETQKITEQIIKEIASIMEAQEHLGAEKENYKHNENAVRIYADILKILKEQDNKERELKLKDIAEERLTMEYRLKAEEFKKEFELKLKEFEIENERKKRELELKAMEEERLARELEFKERQLKKEFENRLRSDIFDLIKTVGSAAAFVIVLLVILKYEETGVITTKIFSPFIGQAFRSLLSK